MVFFALRIARSLAGKISSTFRRISTRLPPTTEAPVYATIAPANAGRPASDAVICIGGRTREHPARRQKVARPMSHCPHERAGHRKVMRARLFPKTFQRNKEAIRVPREDGGTWRKITPEADGSDGREGLAGRMLPSYQVRIARRSLPRWNVLIPFLAWQRPPRACALHRMRMGETGMRLVTIVAIALIVLGVISLAYEGITYTKREEVVEIGPFTATKETRKTIPLPPVLGGVAVIGGVVLLALGARR